MIVHVPVYSNTYWAIWAQYSRRIKRENYHVYVVLVVVFAVLTFTGRERSNSDLDFTVTWSTECRIDAAPTTLIGGKTVQDKPHDPFWKCDDI
jgi:hypothetical protein